MSGKTMSFTMCNSQDSIWFLNIWNALQMAFHEDLIHLRTSGHFPWNISMCGRHSSLHWSVSSLWKAVGLYLYIIFVSEVSALCSTMQCFEPRRFSACQFDEWTKIMFCLCSENKRDFKGQKNKEGEKL